MTVFALQATTMTFAERLAYSVRMLVVGMGMIFTVLCVLWATLAIARRFLTGLEASRAEKAASDEPATFVASPAPAAPVAPTVPADDGALIAAIMAAIAAARTEEGYTGGFRVVSFRRTNEKHAWNRK